MDMNLEELKDAWNAEEGRVDFTGLSKNAGKKVKQPMDAIRHNMRNELFVQFAGILVIAILPALFPLKGLLLAIYYSLFMVLLMITGYYLLAFYRLFKKMHNYNTNAWENLYELYYEIRLHLEMYKSFSFLLLPFVLLLSSLILVSDRVYHRGEILLGSDNSFWIVMLVFGVLAMLLVVLMTNWWVNHFYGKYANQIKSILDEMKG